MKKFALIGAAGFIAPRHMKAIKDTGNVLIAALDPNDSVGILDSYFPEASFFTEFERFERYLEKLKQEGEQIDYLSICSPNYLHDSHIRFGLRLGCNVICEKPLVVNPWNIESLINVEKCSLGKVNTILQLRLHPYFIRLKDIVDSGPKNKIFNVNLKYITSRGKWYDYSWKSVEEKSGGLIYNIGIHFFDILIWIFGKRNRFVIKDHTKRSICGSLYLEKANVDWFLSINREDLPLNIKEKNQMTYREIDVDGEVFEFSDNFTNLHTVSYENILNGNGFGLQAASPSIYLSHEIKKFIS